MALNYTQLVAEVRAELGKSDDSQLITAARAGRWVNQAVKDIVRAYPGLRDVHTVDKTLLRCQQDVYEYPTNVFVVKPIAHILKLRFIDTAQQTYYTLSPMVGGVEAWNQAYPYPPEVGNGYPQVYVYRGASIEVAPVPGANQHDKPLWIEYSYLPGDISVTTVPALTGFDEAIIQLAKGYALRAMEQWDRARETEQQGWTLAERRVESENDFDAVDQLVDEGPFCDGGELY